MLTDASFYFEGRVPLGSVTTVYPRTHPSVLEDTSFLILYKNTVTPLAHPHKEIVREHDINFSHREHNIAARIFSYRGMDIAFSNYGPYWRMMRKLFVQEIISGHNLDACYDLRRQVVMKSVAEVLKLAGLSMDVGKLALQTMIDSTISML
ncbi:hypothetical protein MLD38_018742 [Melastoma candidum]|uniref:Uncharacterized protein n=1 Tax=Melastoma candidum TaxID=119954 RepID=A0ACB9QY97_9MYRT|nr:hypothetical protein MLD38_018742 [Melastoma candidum]